MDFIQFMNPDNILESFTSELNVDLLERFFIAGANDNGITITASRINLGGQVVIYRDTFAVFPFSRITIE